MFRPRVIVVLLLRGSGLVKSVQFKNHKYIGDPINAVKLFNDFEADELVFLDIDATKENRQVKPSLIKDIALEANMPFSIGGGINSLSTIREALMNGADKVVINSAAFNDVKLISAASAEFGQSTIVVSIDVRKDILGRLRVYSNGGKRKHKGIVIDWAKRMENSGAGELFLTSIDMEGTMSGYDIDLIHSISSEVSIPVIAHGGAGKLIDFQNAIDLGHASAVAAGSMFIFQGNRRGVLINYPKGTELNSLLY